MAKLLWLVALLVIAWRMLAGRWPWQSKRKIPGPRGQARALLGVAPDAAREDIIEAHRRLVARVHPDRGGSNEAVHEANAARDLLLSELEARQTERS